MTGPHAANRQLALHQAGRVAARLTGRSRGPRRGFTMIELLVVVALVALGTASVTLVLRDGNAARLERDGQRLAALLEAARAQSRASGVAVHWRTQGQGFVWDSLPGAPLPTDWLHPDTQSLGTQAVTLGPDPIIAPARIALRQADAAAPTAKARVFVVTDGLRPFRVETALAEDAP